MEYDPHALPAGTVIAGYRIVGVLGVGGFGITYEAQSAVTRRRVAIKEFFPRGVASREGATRLVFADRDAAMMTWALERFERSTTELCRLRHPGIVEVIHYVKANNTGYMIMEHVEGETLERWLIGRLNPPSLAELRPVIDPILDALSYVHAAGCIHRDIAPDNIMIRPDGRPVLIDFGEIKILEQHTSVRAYTIAKANYSPPEQTEDMSLDRTADVYSLGAVLYRSVAGMPPADAEQRKGGVALGLGDPYIPLAAAAPDELPPRLAATIDRALSLRSPDRQGSIEELRAGLDWDPAASTTIADAAASGLQERTLDAIAGGLAWTRTVAAQHDPRPRVSAAMANTMARLLAPARTIAAQYRRRPRLVGALAGFAVLAAGAGMVAANTWSSTKAADQCDSRAAAERAIGAGEAALGDFVAACATGPLAVEARQTLDRLIDAREGRLASEAGNDVARLTAYLTTCRRCADRAGVGARLSAASDEAKTFREAAGDLSRIEAYLDRCTICQFRAEAQQAVAELKARPAAPVTLAQKAPAQQPAFTRTTPDADAPPAPSQAPRAIAVTTPTGSDGPPGAPDAAAPPGFGAYAGHAFRIQFTEVQTEVSPKTGTWRVSRDFSARVVSDKDIVAKVTSVTLPRRTSTTARESRGGLGVQANGLEWKFQDGQLVAQHTDTGFVRTIVIKVAGNSCVASISFTPPAGKTVFELKRLSNGETMIVPTIVAEKVACRMNGDAVSATAPRRS